MSEKSQPIESIHDALLLDGNAKNLTDYYARWAAHYNSDLVGNYVGPAVMVKLLVDSLADCFDPAPKVQDLQVMDAGCGTGMLGTFLAEAGVKQLFGTDLSQEMVDEAHKLAIYESLLGGIDLTLPPRQEWLQSFDIVVCCGVFTLGHVEAKVMWELLKMCKPGGVLMVSTRTAFYDNSDFQSVSDAIVDAKAASLMKLVRDAPYTADGDAHYWIYKIH
ncbi:MAG: 2-polyprenyl-3-methyl-5-hydroxy-6-metoxy-1,4-benzoquinol methylase [Parasphingorhabdus sp.]|jgi:2-polyprenyl-3-methyl-5-hydroxy-6-metoxy-1,4-benzoquinol methylase